MYSLRVTHFYGDESIFIGGTSGTSSHPGTLRYTEGPEGLLPYDIIFDMEGECSVATGGNNDPHFVGFLGNGSPINIIN